MNEKERENKYVRVMTFSKTWGSSYPSSWWFLLAALCTFICCVCTRIHSLYTSTSTSTACPQTNDGKT